MTFVDAQVAESLKLTGDALVNLYRIQLRAAPGTPYIYFTDGQTTTWLGQTYDAAPIKLTGTSRNSEEERSRPTLTVTDTLGALVEFAHLGYFDYARVTRHRLLRAHLESNVNLADTRQWYVARIREVIPRQSITLELRSLSDGATQLLPARKYTPPEFPFVTI
jgi:lambda family phage minor tail protein L